MADHITTCESEAQMVVGTEERSLVPRVNPAAVSFSIALASILGVAIGLTYALSPFTVWFCGAMVALFWWAGRELSARERRWVWGVLAVAVALRVLIVAALFISSDGRPLATFPWEPDSGLYKFRSMTIVRVWREMPPAQWGFSGAFDHGYGWSSYVQVLAYLQLLLGKASYGIHLFNTALALTSAVLLHRLVRPSFGAPTALLGLTVLVFWPSWYFSSVSGLRDPSYWFLETLAVVCCVSMARSRDWTRRAAFLVLALGACATLDGIRPGGTMAAISGLLLGLASTAVARRATAAMLTAPLLVVVCVFLWSSSSVGARAMSVAFQAATYHSGVVFTGGGTYRLLDERFYTELGYSTVATLTPAEAQRFVVRAVASVFVFPLPWQSRSIPQVLYIPQQTAWYLLLGFVSIGVVAGLRRDVLVTSVLVSMALVHLAVVAVKSGNFGTLARHRDMAFLFIAWLGALGTSSLLATLLTRRTAQPTE